MEHDIHETVDLAGVFDGWRGFVTIHELNKARL
jgi:hypothetical protein